MSKELQTTTSLKAILSKEDVKKRFDELLGQNSAKYITSIMQVVQSNAMLQKADPMTVLTSAATAAILNLPINNNLGYAYIIPYNVNEKDADGNWQKRVVAQFQMGYKGFIQLAQRTGQYKAINSVCVFENQFKGWNALTEELDADFSIEGKGRVVGYAAYFKLLNGFEKTSFWSIEKMTSHASKFSKSFGQKNSIWKDETGGMDAMGMKTVLKAILAKYGPMEIDTIHRAIQADQSVQKEEGVYTYPDNETPSIEEKTAEKGRDMTLDYINGCNSVEDLVKCREDALAYDCMQEYEDALAYFEEQSKTGSDE